MDRVVIPFSNKEYNDTDVLLLINSIYSIKNVGYDFTLVTEESYYNLVKDHIGFLLNESEIKFIENEYPTYLGMYKFNYYKELREDFNPNVIMIDHDIYLNGEFDLTKHHFDDLFCHSVNRNTVYDRNYISKFDFPFYEDIDPISYGTGMMNFRDKSLLVNYIQLIEDNRHDIDDENIKLYEQFYLAEMCHTLNYRVGTYYDTDHPVKTPDWEGAKTEYMECHVDFTNKDNQYNHFVGGWKRNHHLLALLEENAVKIKQAYELRSKR